MQGNLVQNTSSCEIVHVQYYGRCVRHYSLSYSDLNGWPSINIEVRMIVVRARSFAVYESCNIQ